jgi:antitoxin component YwqK of YwqJK toxin-antitoxin module
VLTLFVGVGIALAIPSILVGWYLLRWRSSAPRTDEGVTRARGRIVSPQSRGELVHQRAANGELLVAERFELRAGVARLQIEPRKADLDVFPRWGRQDELRSGDVVEVIGTLDDEGTLRAARLTRAGWPRVGLVGLCVTVAAAIGAVVAVNQLFDQPRPCPSGTEPRVRRLATSVERSCRRSGTRHGPASIENHVGRVIERGSYRDGVKHGSWWRYHRNGKPAERLDYSDGKRHGRWRKWHLDGGIALEGRYERGRGEARVLHDNGKLADRGAYVGAERDGSWRFWRRDGTLHTRGSYARGKKHGRFVRYHEDGKTKRSEGYFAGGKRDRVWTWWRPDGTRERRGLFDGGKRSGVWFWWHDNGKVARRGAFRVGKKHGRWLFYDQAGERQIKGGYHDGKRVGPWRWQCATCKGCDPCDGKSADAVVDKDYGPPQSAPSVGPLRPL